jgi:Na+/H+ antiporter
MKDLKKNILLLTFLALANVLAAMEVKLPNIIMRGMENEIVITGLKSDTTTVLMNGIGILTIAQDGRVVLKYDFPEKETLTISCDNQVWQQDVSPIPLWLSIIPPLIAIFMTLLVKEVFSALFLGVFSGAFIIHLYQGLGFLGAFLKGILSSVDTYLIQALNDSGHLSIIVFSMLIGGTVQLVTLNGGMKGIVIWLSKYAKSPRSGQLITYLMGIAIFFDDYANTLVVGNTMRPITDRLKISREKLAYIVDSTAAPVVATAFVTTWIGAELSYIQEGINNIGLEMSAYSVFFRSLAYSFYPFLTLVFMFILIVKQSDFGPMYRFEQRARQIVVPLDKESCGEKCKIHAYNALIPILVLVLGTITGLIYSGWNPSVWNDGTLSFTKKISAILGEADSYKALLWSSILSFITAIILTVGQKHSTFKKAMEESIEGFKTMFNAILILTLAWAIALVTKELHTADYVSGLLLDLSFSPFLVPSLTFVLAALIAFSTGTSWGTMAILYPLILPATWLLAQNEGVELSATMPLFFNVVASVMAGAVLGDHCSPISDTTIMSSLASSCDHLKHVKTQMPYALTVGAVSLFFGILPTSFGVSPIISFVVSVLVLWLIVKFFGKSLEH